MDLLLKKSFDFSIRVLELAKYLEEENRQYPLCDRLLVCATEIGVSLRLAASAGKMSSEINQKALRYAEEAEYLLELMSKTDYLSEKQSMPIIGDCRGLKAMISELSGKPKKEGFKRV